MGRRTCPSGRRPAAAGAGGRGRAATTAPSARPPRRRSAGRRRATTVRPRRQQRRHRRPGRPRRHRLDEPSLHVQRVRRAPSRDGGRDRRVPGPAPRPGRAARPSSAGSRRPRRRRPGARRRPGRAARAAPRRRRGPGPGPTGSRCTASVAVSDSSPTSSSSGVPTVRIAASRASPETASTSAPVNRTCTTVRSCSGAGQPASRGTRRSATDVPASSGSVGAHSRQACSTSAAAARGPDDPAPVEPGQREQRELQLGDDAEPAAARAAQRPVQLRGAVGVDLVRAAVGGDQAQAAQVVRGEPVPAPEQAQAAAERVAGHPDPGRGGDERGEAVRGGRGEDLRPRGAGPDAGRAGPRVDGDGVEPAGRDQHRRGRVRGAAVTGTLDPDGQPVGAGTRHGGDDVVLALRADDDARPPGDGGVERGDLGRVAGVRRAQDGPGDRRQAAAAGAAGEGPSRLTDRSREGGGRAGDRRPLCRRRPPLHEAIRQLATGDRAGGCATGEGSVAGTCRRYGAAA